MVTLILSPIPLVRPAAPAHSRVDLTESPDAGECNCKLLRLEALHRELRMIRAELPRTEGFV
jgi:hypothetical protein